MSEYRDDAVLTETMERIRRAELACVLTPPGSPEHARAVERLDRATRQLRRLAEASATHAGGCDAGSVDLPVELPAPLVTDPH